MPNIALDGPRPLPLWVKIAGSVAAGLPLTVLWGMRLVRRARNAHDRFFIDTKPIEIGVAEAARATGAPILQLASAVFVLFRREAFSLAFFLVALVTARRAVYPALVAVGLSIVAVTLLLHQTEIGAAISAHPSDQARS